MADSNMDVQCERSCNNVPKKEGRKLPQYIAAIVVNTTTLVHGAGLGWLSPILPILQSDNSPIGRRITDEEGSWIGALICLGAIFGTPLYMYITNNTSRKVAGYLVAVPYILAYILIIFANSVGMLYAGRFLVGVGSAATTGFTPLYVTEIAEDSVRGALGSFYVLSSYFGVLLVYVYGSYATYNETSTMMLSIIVLYLLSFYFMPETPTYLVSKCNVVEASMSLKWLRGKDVDVIEEELKKLNCAFENRRESGSSMSLKQMVTSRGTRTALIISLLLVTNLQMSAPVAIFSYAVTIFKDAGSTLSPNTSSIIVGILQIMGTFAATLLIDRAGRRILLILSNLFMVICFSGLGIYFYCKINGFDVSGVTWFPLVCLSTYVVTLAFGVSPIPFLMIPELFLPHARSTAILISLTFMWLVAFLVTKFFTNIAEAFGIYICYWIFGSCCFVGLLLSVFLYPETKNKSIDMIFQELNKSKSSRAENRNLPY